MRVVLVAVALLVVGHQAAPAPLAARNHHPYSHHQGKRRGKRGRGQGEDFRQCLTLVHVVVGHDGDALLPHHADVRPIAVTSPEEHGQQDGLGNGAPQHTQHHPVVGTVKLQAGEAHHLGKRCLERLRSINGRSALPLSVLHHDGGDVELVLVSLVARLDGEGLEESDADADHTHGHTAAYQQQKAHTEAQTDLPHNESAVRGVEAVNGVVPAHSWKRGQDEGDHPDAHHWEEEGGQRTIHMR
ncbi:hypothetical protein EYF80_013200 [Liparis tanakae]|uniref:Secreted protein n=1 Tax=Liparis tanakae TaxID=230148 RepID=A0A4Z2IF70_9TELE|nr:hypothetical protein EYF80_013200 [Liparis tanakae]